MSYGQVPIVIEILAWLIFAPTIALGMFYLFILGVLSVLNVLTSDVTND
jgi:hypothetical protein